MVSPKGYKQTEIGMIPEDWAVVKAKQLMRIETGSRNTEHKTNYGQYPFFVRSQQIEHIDTYHYNCEAVLTAGDGVGTGKVFHYYNGKFDAHQRVYIMFQFSDIDAKYFYFYFRAKFGAEVSKYTAKSSVDSVRRDMIAEMLIPLPSLREQQHIANALSDVDHLISSLEKLITKKKTIKQGAMQELLTGKKRLPGFVGKWEEHFLVDRVKTSSGGTPSRAIESYYKGNIPWVTTSELNDRVIYGTTECITEKAIANSSTKIFPRDTVLVAMYGATIGKLAILGKPMATNQACCALISNENKMDYRYLFFLLQFMRDELISLGCGAGQPNISQKIIQKLAIYIPITEEQQAIAQVLSDMDTEIQKLEQKLEKYRQVKQGMMQQLLTGKIRLV
ncbi:restriction endonuclease subunit S [Lachnospiraceae bacterium 62-35]